MWDKQTVIENCTEVLHIYSTYVKVYSYQNIILARLGNYKETEKDLGLSTKYDFEQDNINGYCKVMNINN